MTPTSRREQLPAFQAYACQAGYAPFTALSAREQAQVEAQADGAIQVRELWWKRVRTESGWAWEPLAVKEGNC